MTQELTYRLNPEQERRLRWWRDARFGMFIHWGLYSALAREGEWDLQIKRMPAREYEKFANQWKPRRGAPREWARLARDAGMKYAVLTTKHHEGFCLWDTRQTDYNAVCRGPRRDLVREYVDACREFGIKVGLYYSLLDWHHPDAVAAVLDEKARRRFIDFTHGCVEELMTNYGKVDELWYDGNWPLTAEQWESARLDTMVRRLQPNILINDRSGYGGDFGTPEGAIASSPKGKAWEACMTRFAWGYIPAYADEWFTPRDVLRMLRESASGQGNLLLNIGPKPDGSVPVKTTRCLKEVGRWLAVNGEAVYGRVTRVSDGLYPYLPWTVKGKTAYYWCFAWSGTEWAVGGIHTPVKKAWLVGSKKPLRFRQEPDRLVLMGLPATCPDKGTGVAVIKLEFARLPRQTLGLDCTYHEIPAPHDPPLINLSWESPFVRQWQVSDIVPFKGDVADARCVKLSAKLNWQAIEASGNATDLVGFLNVHARHGNRDGLVYAGNRFRVSKAGTWRLHLGHDAAARVFVDGKSVLCEPVRRNPASPRRSMAEIRLSRGVHEIMIALDTDHGMGWGFFFSFEVPESQRKKGGVYGFPEVA